VYGSYSHLVAAMAVSLALYEIFSVKLLAWSWKLD